MGDHHHHGYWCGIPCCYSERTPAPAEPVKKMWHCYSAEHRTGGGSNVRSVNVSAETAEEATAAAARLCGGIPGPWTVIEGTPVHLSVSEFKTYTAKRV